LKLFDWSLKKEKKRVYDDIWDHIKSSEKNSLVTIHQELDLKPTVNITKRKYSIHLLNCSPVLIALEKNERELMNYNDINHAIQIIDSIVEDDNNGSITTSNKINSNSDSEDDTVKYIPIISSKNKNKSNPISNKVLSIIADEKNLYVNIQARKYARDYFKIDNQDLDSESGEDDNYDNEVLDNFFEENDSYIKEGEYGPVIYQLNEDKIIESNNLDNKYDKDNEIIIIDDYKIRKAKKDYYAKTAKRDFINSKMNRDGVAILNKLKSGGKKVKDENYNRRAFESSYHQPKIINVVTDAQKKHLGIFISLQNNILIFH
jgi:hypothetical protein